MKKRLLVICLLIFVVTGCYLPIKGQVVDAETSQPIEGAIVLVEWTKKHGFGDAWTESYKVVEAVSDKDGKVNIEGCYSPFVKPPDVTVYKRGYVTWSSRNVFPSMKKRDDFHWRSNETYKLDKFNDTYSYTDHYGFTTSAINSALGGINDKQRFLRAFSEAEESKVIQEQNERDRQRHGGIVR